MNAPVIIKRAGPGDAATLADLAARTFAETFGHLYRREDLDAFLASSHSIEAHAAKLADPGTAVWLAETASGTAAGYASVGPCSLPVEPMPEKAGELGRLYIDQRFQGEGLGTRLLETALSWLERQYGPLFISVFSENVGAQRLYRRYGFEKAGEYRFMVGAHADREFIFARHPQPPRT